jgi:hypothetical protein
MRAGAKMPYALTSLYFIQYYFSVYYMVLLITPHRLLFLSYLGTDYGT